MDRVAELLTRAIAAHAFPACTIEVGRANGVVWREAFGRLTYAADAPATREDTIFDLASLTKVIATTTLMMRAVDERRIAPDERLADRLPEWRGEDRARVTVRDLLEHASGLTAYLPFFRDHHGRAEFQRAICTLPLEYAPRTQSIYSDLGFMLLAFMLEEAYRISFAQLFDGVWAGLKACATEPSGGTRNAGLEARPTEAPGGTRSAGLEARPTEPSSGTRSAGLEARPTEAPGGTRNAGLEARPTEAPGGTRSAGLEARPTEASGSTRSAGLEARPTEAPGGTRSAGLEARPTEAPGSTRSAGLQACPADDLLLFNPPRELRERCAPTELDLWRGRLLQGEVHDENTWALGGAAGHAGLFGTAAAVGCFARAVLDGLAGGAQLASPGTIAAFVQKSTVPGSSRALGWDTMLPTSSCGTRMSPRAIGHTGFTGTSLWIDPAQDFYVVLLMNRVHPVRDNDQIQAVRRRVHDEVVRSLS